MSDKITTPFERSVLLSDFIVRLLIEQRIPITQIRFRADIDPLRVELPRRVRSDDGSGCHADPGEHRAYISKSGAVSVIMDDGGSDGVRLGVKPGEFSFVCPYADGTTTLATREGGAKAWTVIAHQSRLWVAEPWRAWRNLCDGGDNSDDHECQPHCDQTYVSYRATPREGYRPRPDRQRITYLDKSSPLDDRRLQGPWLLAEDMPRTFSRLLLDVSSVRLERLSDATAQDMRAAGATCSLDVGSPHCTAMPCDSLRQSFRSLMNGTIDHCEFREDAPVLTSDSWVWAVECRRLPIGKE